MPTIHVARGVQFRPDVYNPRNRTPWLQAVGDELQARGVTVKVGDGANALEVRNAAELTAAFQALQAAGAQPVPGYLSDLVQLVDDTVKPGSKTKAGDVFDYTRGSEASRVFGLDNPSFRYASGSTEFGQLARLRPSGTMVINGATFQIIERADAIDLTAIPHMSAETFRNAPVGYGRDGEEVEDTRVISSMTKEEVVALAQTSLNDLQRPRSAAGFTLGRVPLDEMRWDSEAHALRRANPYVSFTLDDRSFEVNPNSGQPRVAIGRDFFFDAFMAKKDLVTNTLTRDLQKAGLMYRGRIRYGSDRDPFAGTRVLIGMKEGTAIDADGTKHARKIDCRTDSVTQTVLDSLIKSTQTGMLDPSWQWGGASRVAPPGSAMYRVAVQKGITENIGGETNVLAMETGATARQIRGRFHLNETAQASLLSGFGNGQPSIEELQTLITAAADWPATAELPSKTDLLAQTNALVDRSSIVASATAGLLALDPSLVVDKALIDRLWPGQRPNSKSDAKLQRVVADAIRTQYDAFAENVDGLQREIAGNTDRTVRNAGSAGDVCDFLREKAAVARVAAHARGTAGVADNPASHAAYVQTVIAMADGREKTELLQRIGVGLSQLRDMNEAAFASPVQVNPDLAKKQTLKPFLTELDAQLAGPNTDAFTAELATALAAADSPVLQNAADKAPVLQNLRKNMVAAHAEVLHRMVEGAGAWGQALWFNGYRETMLGIDPMSWNFIIGSMDYTEFYDAPTGLGLTFQERVSRTPLDSTRMTGAMISNDIQIELDAEEGYTAAIRTAQYAVNAAVAGLMMDFALDRGTPGLVAGDSAAFERWFTEQAALPAAERQTFIDAVSAFATAKGSRIDVAQAFAPLEQQEKAIRLLVAFAAQKNPALNVTDRAGVETWFRQQDLSEEFLTEVAQFASEQKSEIPLSPNLLRTLDFEPFAGTNVGQNPVGHAQLSDDLAVATEVWAMMKKAQSDLSAARGVEVQAVLEDNNLQGKGWEPPTKPKGDYAIDFALPA